MSNLYRMLGVSDFSQFIFKIFSFSIKYIVTQFDIFQIKMVDIGKISDQFATSMNCFLIRRPTPTNIKAPPT